MEHNRLLRFSFGLCCGSFFVCAVNFFLDVTPASVDNAVLSWAQILTPIFGALLAVFGISKQIAATQELARKEREDKLAASSAFLPIALSALDDVCRVRAHFVAAGRHAQFSDDRLELPGSTLEVLRDCIQYEKDERRANLRRIVRSYQVLVDIYAKLKVEQSDSLFEYQLDWEAEDIKRAEVGARLTNIEDWIALGNLCLELMPVYDDSANNHLPSFDNLRRKTLLDLESFSDERPDADGGETLYGWPFFRRYLQGLSGQRDSVGRVHRSHF